MLITPLPVASAFLSGVRGSWSPSARMFVLLNIWLGSGLDTCGVCTVGLVDF